MEPNKEIIFEQLERIMQDKNFSRSKIYGRLLKFLVQTTLDKKEVKEVTIGTELFGKTYDPIKFDNKVRVYIYHLRKKLADYYSSTASKDELVFVIEKGQYHVKFTEHKDLPQEEEKGKRTLIIALGILLALIIGLLSYQWLKPKNSFWESTFSNNYPINVVFGDYFAIEGPILGDKLGMVRDYSINSLADFQEYSNKHPDKVELYKPANQMYSSAYAPYCSFEICKFFFERKVDFDVNVMSDWNTANINKENIVYIGQSKLMGILGNVLTETYPNYTFKPEKIIRKDPNSNDVVTFNDAVKKDDKLIDFTVVAKLKTESGNYISYFLSDQDFGIISTLQYFTNNDSVNSFYNRHQIENKDFIAVYKVTGWQRKSYNMQLLHIDIKH